MIPAILSGLAVSELPEFIAAEYIRDGRMEAILTDWAMAKGGLYFVTPSSRSRPAKVEVLARFFIERLSSPEWLFT
jgi:DNA-binding transcriptional LysR family regulator